MLRDPEVVNDTDILVLGCVELVGVGVVELVGSALSDALEVILNAILLLDILLDGDIV